MRIVRVKAVVREGLQIFNEDKLILLCAIDEQDALTDGEWFGYTKDENGRHPFILEQRKQFFFGADGGDIIVESTNIKDKQIKVGALFTVFTPSMVPSGRDDETTFEITTVHTLQS